MFGTFRALIIFIIILTLGLTIGIVVDGNGKLSKIITKQLEEHYESRL